MTLKVSLKKSPKRNLQEKSVKTNKENNKEKMRHKQIKPNQVKCQTQKNRV